MELTHAQIKDALSKGCSESEFTEMRCPECGDELVFRAHPDGTFFVRCRADSGHLSMHGENLNPPDWWRRFTSELGWY